MSILKKIDWKLVAPLGFIMAASLVSLYSTSPIFFWRQLSWYSIGLFVMFVFTCFDWRSFANYRNAIFSLYGVSILLLVVVGFFSPAIRGVRGWIVFGPVQFQAVEAAKFSLIVLYANFFRKRGTSSVRSSDILKSFAFFVLPAALVALQPDFGSMLTLFGIWFGFLLVSGLRWRHILIFAAAAAVLGLILWNGILADYQKQRIVGVFYPESDPLGVNYSVIQAKIAVGSAGLFGKGFGRGTQTQLGFLTEPQTDFIFSAFVEEWGILGSALLLAAFVLLILRILKIGAESGNKFGQFVALGTAILFSVQFLLNVGSNLGITPVIGVTFPFLSYGGSSVLTNFALIGIISSINLRRSL